MESTRTLTLEPQDVTAGTVQAEYLNVFGFGPRPL
jgi:hypothetical protein